MSAKSIEATSTDGETAPVDLPSDDWLGLHCPHEKARCSGLWNQRHVEETHYPGFLSVLENLTAEQIGEGG